MLPDLGKPRAVELLAAGLPQSVQQLPPRYEVRVKLRQRAQRKVWVPGPRPLPYCDHENGVLKQRKFRWCSVLLRHPAQLTHGPR